ncbi:unnamed protein product [Owenia fusiformis]|uniref:Fatty acid synthase n=1 Tax=Owenia fusiformis TaxID=6347 RepID=A0A8S4NE03_OWEFU|nr:unnamed protein product [Owenia fusiformis]
MDYKNQGLLHDMFVRQALATPDNVAVVADGGTSMTFGELNEATDVVSTHLRHIGVAPNTCVGIYMSRRIEYVISYIAILKAGGGYMPMDPSYPKHLVDEIVKDSTPVAVIAEQQLSQNIDDSRTKVIVISPGWIDELKKTNASNEPLTTSPGTTLDDLAYIVYSSGTTGKPKGIQCPHRGAVFSYHYRHTQFPYGDHEREACNVFFVWEMLRPLLKGVAMYIIPDTKIYDPKLLCEFLMTNEITRILFTPSLLEAVLEYDGIIISDYLKSMRTIIFCGEVVTVALLERCLKLLPWVRFLNLYSISESHDVTYADLSNWYKSDVDHAKSKKFCPVGKLIPEVKMVILNEALEPEPLGVSGEIYIGGPTLAIGYLNRPQLNEQRFIKRPIGVSPKVGERLYKAGDCGYLLSDGSFEICGRLDSMVKIRGYSIETQAVEAAILELPMVNTGVVLARGAEGEDKYLVAYVVPEGQTTKKEIRAALKLRLPFYMIPSYIIFLTSLPVLAASGKLDKKALPPLDASSNSPMETEGLPKTETEKELVPIWCDVLGLISIDTQESFFDLGGHSLTATRLLNKLLEKFNLELSVSDLFNYSTISAMGRLIDSKRGKATSDEVNIARDDVDLLKEVDRHDQAVVNMDIQLRAFWRSIKYGDRWNTGRVLLTGSTGFLGAFILRDLLLRSKTQIFCLVREQPNVDGHDRVKQTLEQFGILNGDNLKTTEDQALLQKQFDSRVQVINGDVALVNLGVKDDMYAYLTTEIDFIVHAAAYVNLIYPYEALHGPNVLGTQNVLLFACTSKIKPLHYISTDAVFPNGLLNCKEDDDMRRYATKLTDGYSQSKWVAEQLVQRAIDRGLPAAIYRLGNLSGDSVSACWNPQDFTLLMIRACLQTGSAPIVDWNVEMTPVDFVSTCITKFTQNIMAAMGKIFHIVNTKPLNSSWLFEWLSAHNYTIKLLPYSDWTKCVQNDDKVDNEFKRLLCGMMNDESYLSELSTYDNTNFATAVQGFGLEYPQISRSLIETYITSLAQKGVIPKPTKNIFKGRLAYLTTMGFQEAHTNQFSS